MTPGIPGQLVVKAQLHAAQPDEVAADEPEHLRREAALGVLSHRVLVEVHARDVETLDLLGERGRHVALEHRGSVAVLLDAALDLVGGHLQQRAQRGRRLVDVAHQRPDAIHAVVAHADRQRVAVGVQQRAAAGFDRNLRVSLGLRQLLEAHACRAPETSTGATTGSSRTPGTPRTRSANRTCAPALPSGRGQG